LEIKIGVSDSPREIALDSEETHESIQQAVQKAIDDGAMLSLTDDRGRTVLVPAAKIAYVEIGPSASRKVGFGSLT
jgi:peptidyl-tRNA hydrolase